MMDANGWCSVAAATQGHPGFLQQQCSYELQHSSALRYAFSAAEFGNGAAEFGVSMVHPPLLQESSLSNVGCERQEYDGAAAGGVVAETVETGTCTVLDAHEVSAVELASHAKHPAAYPPLRCLSRLPSPHAAVFVPAGATTTRASRRRHRRTRRDRAAQIASLQTLDAISTKARQLVSCSAEQAVALATPVTFSADQLQALNLPVLARKRGGSAMRRLALRERKRASVPVLQSAARRWLARRLAARLLADRQQAARLREQHKRRDSEAQRAREILRTAGPCPAYPALGSLSEWAQSMWEWLHRAGLGAALAEASLSSYFSSLTYEVQQVCASFSSELQHALGHFSAGVVRMVDREFGFGESQHGGRMFQAVLGGISIIVPEALLRRPQRVRAQWTGGRGKGRKFLGV